MAESEREVVAFAGWPKGLNLGADNTLLLPDELAEATNVILGPRGELQARPGQVNMAFGDTANKYTFIRPWLQNVNTLNPGVVATKLNGDTYLTWFDGDNPQEELITSGTNLVAPWEAVVMNNKMYIAGLATAYEVVPDGTGIGTTTELTAWNLTADTTTNFPHASILLVAYERIFAVDTETIANVSKYRLFFSDPLLPKTWKALSYIDISPDDGQAITALRFFADQIIIFKERSIWGLSGKDFTSLNLELYQIDGSIGCNSPQSIVDVGGGLLAFYDPNKGIFLFDGSGFKNIGHNIFGTTSPNLLPDGVINPEKVCGWAHSNRYYLSYTITGGNYRTLVYDLKLEAWTKWDRGFESVSRAIDYAPEPDNPPVVVGVASSTNGWNGIRTFLTDAEVDQGNSNIPIKVKTGWVSPSAGFAPNRIKQTVIDARKVSVVMDYKVFIDHDTTAAVATAQIDHSLGEEDGKMTRTHSFNPFRWRALMLEISGSQTVSATAPWELSSVRMLVSTLQHTRGTV